MSWRRAGEHRAHSPDVGVERMQKITIIHPTTDTLVCTVCITRRREKKKRVTCAGHQDFGRTVHDAELSAIPDGAREGGQIEKASADRRNRSVGPLLGALRKKASPLRKWSSWEAMDEPSAREATSTRSRGSLGGSGGAQEENYCEATSPASRSRVERRA